MDAFVLVAIIVVAMPVAVFAALAISARLRGPMSRPESRKRVGSLVTEAIPEEHRHDEEDLETGPPFNLDSSPPEPDPQLRSRDAG